MTVKTILQMLVITDTINSSSMGNGRVSTIEILIGKGPDIKKKDELSIIMIELDFELLFPILTTNYR